MCLQIDNPCWLSMKKSQGMPRFGQWSNYPQIISLPFKEICQVLMGHYLLQIKASPWRGEVHLLIYHPWGATVTWLVGSVVADVDTMRSNIL